MLTDIAETAIHVPHRLHFLNEFPIDKLTFSIHGDYVGYASPQAAVTVTTGCKQSLSGPKVNNPNIWVVETPAAHNGTPCSRHNGHIQNYYTYPPQAEIAAKVESSVHDVDCDQSLISFLLTTSCFSFNSVSNICLVSLSYT